MTNPMIPAEAVEAAGPHCRNCGNAIRWVETMGWVHGRLGEGYNVLCHVGASTEAEVGAGWLKK